MNFLRKNAIPKTSLTMVIQLTISTFGFKVYLRRSYKIQKKLTTFQNNVYDITEFANSTRRKR